MTSESSNNPDVEEVDVECPHCGHSFVVEVESVQSKDETQGPIFANDVDPGPWHKLSEVERRLGLSRKSVKKRIYDGRLRAKKFGDAAGSPWHVSEQALQEYIRSGR